MSLREQLQPASFRGVDFLVSGETKIGGKKTVTHEFVNSDVRFTEELGGLPPSFTIEAIVHGETALAQRFNLERVLDKPGLGTLVHPVYGSIQVKSTTYSVNSSQSKIGEFRFSLSFETTTAAVSFLAPLATASAVSKASDAARLATDAAFLAKFKDPTNPSELTAAADKADSIYDTVFTSINSTVGTVQTKVADMTRFVANARNNVFSIVQQGSQLKDSLKDLYKAGLDVVNLPADLSDAWTSLLDFGFLDQEGKTNTTSRESEENNRRMLNDSVRLNALINLFESFAFKDFLTDTELLAAQALLSSNYSLFMEQFTTPSLATDPDTRTTMANLRATTNKVFDQQLQNIWRVVTISPGRSSMSLVAYRYYEGLDQLDQLTALNPNVNHATFNQDIQAVSR